MNEDESLLSLFYAMYDSADADCCDVTVFGIVKGPFESLLCPVTQLRRLVDTKYRMKQRRRRELVITNVN